MARTSTKSRGTNEEEVTTSTDETTEATEAVEATEVEATIDLTAFEAVVNLAIASANDTGDLDEEHFAAVSEQYHALEGIKAKNAAKKVLGEGMREYLDQGDLGKAKAYMKLQDKATVATKAATVHVPRVPADPALAIAEKVHALTLAAEWVKDNLPEDVTPEAVNEKVFARDNQADRDALAAYVAWHADEAEDKGDEPEVDAVVRAAARLARVKTPGGKTGPRSVGSGLRRNVAAHVTNAFGKVESGDFLTVSEIVHTHSDEYGEDLPSAGAVSVRLFPNNGKPCNIEGITPGTNNKGIKGATKV